MTITLTTPEGRADIEKVELVSLSANLVDDYVELTFRIGYVNDGAFVEVRRQKLTFSDDLADADFTFAQLIANIPEAASLKTALEQGVIDFSVFAGTVD